MAAPFAANTQELWPFLIIIIITNLLLLLLIRRDRSCSASDSAYFHTFLLSVVCLSSVCHIHTRCLNRSTHLDVIWQVNLWGSMTHCIRWVSLTPGRGDLAGRTPPPASSQNTPLQIAAKPLVLCCHLANTNQRFRLFLNYFGPTLAKLEYDTDALSCVSDELVQYGKSSGT